MGEADGQELFNIIIQRVQGHQKDFNGHAARDDLLPSVDIFTTYILALIDLRWEEEVRERCTRQ